MHIEFLNLTQTCCVTLEVLFYLIWEEEGGGERGLEKAKALYIGLNMPPVIIKGKGLACDCHLLPKCIAWENQSVIALCLSFFIS